MVDIFLQVINRSISASWLIPAVLVFRLVFRGAPKWIHVMLWGMVAVRLLCPFSIESAVSLLPEEIGDGSFVEEMIHDDSPYYDAAVTNGRKPIPTGEGRHYVVAADDQLGEPATVKNTVVPILADIWAVGIAVFLAYTATSYWRLRRKVHTAVRLRDNIFQCETVGSPFVLGMIKPKIYLPFEVDVPALEHVAAHEQAHIKRRDHWWKPLGFLLLTIHWFHPLMWLAYVLLCRDIELACDEKVIKELGDEQRADYAQALLAYSVNHHMITACPLAFGEVGVKERVKSVLNYKKPAFRVIAVSVIACVAVAVCFLTNPKAGPQEIQVNGSMYLRQEADVAVLPEGSYELGALDRILHHTEAHPDENFSAVNLDEKYAGNMLYQSGAEADVIYLEDFSGFYIPFKTALKDGAVGGPADDTPSAEADPVTWTYSPMMSATWHAAFHFHFALNYSHIEASCDHGTLWDFSTEGQPRDKTLRFEAGNPVCWTPGVGESLEDTATEATVRFTVYNGGEILYTGAFEITRTGTEHGKSLYEARLGGTDLLTLEQASGNMGGTVNLSNSAAITMFSDLDHDGKTENVVVRTLVPTMLYELAIEEQDGTKIWTTEAGPAHTAWNTIMMYSEGGQDYLVQYLPSMFQGAGSYTCTVFSLEGGRQRTMKEWSVEFEVEPGDPVSVTDTPEMAQFAKEVGLLLRNSTVLLSTEQGILVDRPMGAAALPQLYPVRFHPDEIQAEIDGTADVQELSPNAAQLPDTPLELLFASGAGAWGTTLTLNPDGSFTGSYSDAEMGDNGPEYPHGTYYVCDFEGRFTDIRQISDYAFSMKLESLTADRPEGETWVEDQIRYIASDPYGLTGGEDFVLYALGTPADELPAEFRDWWPDAWLWRNGEAEQLTGWGLCNVNTGHGFFQS